MAQQTAVEWLEEKMKKLTPPGYQTEISAMLEQAKQMEKEQIKQNYNAGLFDGEMDIIKCRIHKDAEQYYNETFGKL